MATLGTCRLGNRLAAFRLGYTSRARNTAISITLNGQPIRVRLGSVTIHSVLNDAPDTCTLTIDGSTPPLDSQLLNISINLDNPRVLFEGVLSTVGASYQERPGVLWYPCTAVDELPRANRRLPYGQWVNVSATQFAQDLIAKFVPGYTSHNVQPNLPLISINLDGTEGVSGALTQAAKLIGGYFYFESLDLHFFQEELTEPPAPIDASHPFCNDPPITQTLDDSQIRTRVYGKGYADSLASAVNVAETILPVGNTAYFNPAGGQAVSETQRIAYTGIDPGGKGSLVGPGIGPAAPMVATQQDGPGVNPGAHNYACTFVTATGESLLSPVTPITVGLRGGPPDAPVNAGGAGGGAVDIGTHGYALTDVTTYGETVNGPTVAIAVGNLPTPTLPPTATGSWSISSQGLNDPPGWGAGVTVYFQITYGNVPDITAQSPLGPQSVGIVLRQAAGLSAGNWNSPQLNLPGSADPRVQWITVWGYAPGQPGPPVPYFSARAQMSAGSIFAYGGGGATNYPGANPAMGTVKLTIAAGGTNVTNRKLYRTKAGASQLQLLATLAAAGGSYTDAAADSTLGANVPTVGTATAAKVALSAIPLGGTSVTGRKLYRSKANLAPLQLLATLADNVTTTYADTLADATLGASPPAGDTSGLTQPAGQILPGSSSIIVAGVSFARPGGGWVISGPQLLRYTGLSGNALTGIPASGPGAITAAIAYSTTIIAVPILFGVTGLAIALIQGAPINLWIQCDDTDAQAELAARDGTDGIVEHLIIDERRAEASLRSLLLADLFQYSRSLKTVVYATRDLRTAVGKSVTINLGQPAISDTLTIQTVDISEIGIVPGGLPKFTANASNVRFSLDDLLRRMATTLGGT
jgi:hypothetical protein